MPTYSRLIRFGYGSTKMEAISYGPATSGLPRPTP
jgi:hypothetical protein